MSTTQRPTPNAYSLVVIVGPTASGKSDLAMRIAQELNGEIICADSRTVYRDMDIGTAKPTADDRKAIRHWGLDLVKPGQSYSAGKFKQYAEGAIADIQLRDKLPIMVGGTGLYVDGLIFDFSFTGTRWRRALYAWRSGESLRKHILKQGWPMPENNRNKRHLLRTIERKGRVGGKQILPPGVLVIGLSPENDVLKERIAQRAESMFSSGVIEETKRLRTKYGRRALNKTGGIVYRIVQQLIDGKLTREQAIEQFKTADWQYARRQKTWFKRNEHINWFSGPTEAFKYVRKHLVNT